MTLAFIVYCNYVVFLFVIGLKYQSYCIRP